MNRTAFDTLSAARTLEAAGIESKQAEAIVQTIRSSGEAAATRADLDAATGALDGKLATVTAELRGEMKAMAAELRGEINAAVNKMLLAQLAIAGLLFAAIKVFV